MNSAMLYLLCMSLSSLSALAFNPLVKSILPRNRCRVSDTRLNYLGGVDDGAGILPLSTSTSTATKESASTRWLPSVLPGVTSEVDQRQANHRKEREELRDPEEQCDLDSYLEFLDRRYNRLHGTVGHREDGRKDLFLAWNWLFDGVSSSKRSGAPSLQSHDNALYALDVAKLASNRLLQKHPIPTKSSTNGLLKNAESKDFSTYWKDVIDLTAVSGDYQKNSYHHDYCSGDFDLLSADEVRGIAKCRKVITKSISLLPIEASASVLRRLQSHWNPLSFSLLAPFITVKNGALLMSCKIPSLFKKLMILSSSPTKAAIALALYAISSKMKK